MSEQEQLLIDSVELMADFIQTPIFIFQKKNLQLVHESGNDNQIIFSKEIIAHLFSLPLKETLSLFYLAEMKGRIVCLPVHSTKEYLLLIFQSQKQIAHNPFPVETKKLLKSGILLHQMIFQKKLDYEEVVKNNQHLLSPLLSENPIEMALIPIREENKFHKTYLSEKYLGDCVIRGNVSELKIAFTNYMDQGIAGTLSNNSLRHKKNILISVITMTTRSAMQGGLPEEEAYLMSDLYIQKIEELTDIEDVTALTYNVMIDFAERVKQHQHQHVSFVISSCQKYIRDHLYDKLSIKNIADQLHVSFSYLSSQFKKETGQTITHYIQEQRIEEAKQLILFSDYTLAKIYTLLNFTDQSHFTKVFKKYTGTTPKKFQNRYIYR